MVVSVFFETPRAATRFPPIAVKVKNPKGRAAVWEAEEDCAVNPKTIRRNRI